MTMHKKRENHGHSTHRLYRIYNHMRRRCYESTNPKFKNYGGRGITICDEWLNSFQAFYDWAMANGYDDNLTIDRIDNDGNYSPENCRWAMQIAQQNNKSTNKYVEYQGESMTIADASRASCIPIRTLWWRSNKGWRGDKLFSPVRIGRKKYESNA